MKLRVVQHKHMENKLDCSKIPYYQCFANLIKDSKFENCTSKCLPKNLTAIGGTDFPNIPPCQTDEEAYDSWTHIYYEIFSDEHFPCLESCTIREYTGKVDYEEPIQDNHTFGMTVRFARPYKMTTYEEYLLYDFTELVGSVGGTLGLFIGFSFYDIILKITYLINFMRMQH